MTTGVTLTAAAPALQAWAALINAAGGLQRLEVFASTRPATGGTPATGPMFTAALPTSPATVAAGVLTLAAPGPSALVIADGPPVWARFYGGDGAALFDWGARLSSDPDAGEEVVVLAPVLAAGAIVRVSVGSITLPT